MREVLVVSLKKSEFEPLFIVSRPISERASMPSSPLAALEEAERRLGRLSVTPARVDGGALRCGGCGERVTGRYLVAPNKKAFHPDCLRCELCGAECKTFASDPKRPNVLCCMGCYDDRYAERCTRCDRPLKGEILTALERTGKARDTLVLFTSEQGSQFPGCKWTNWNTGLHTALVARWPGYTPAGKRTDALVQYADILPTLLSAAGGNPARHPYDGTSFLPVLKGHAQTHRKFVYGIHNNLPEGPAYPIRSVSDGTYRYIRNLRPDELYIEKHLMGGKGDAVLKNPYWPTWLREAWTNPKTYQLVKRYMRRPAEELYHTEKDPYELTNLALTRAHAGRLSILSAELDRWMAGQGDPGRAVDTPEALKAAREGKHLHGPQNNNTDR